jgi:hypothetical protein
MVNGKVVGVGGWSEWSGVDGKGAGEVIGENMGGLVVGR